MVCAALVLVLSGSAARADGRAERLAALSAPITYKSAGVVRAVGIGVDRSMTYRLTAAGGAVRADLTRGGKTQTARLAVAPDGSMTADDPAFVNVCNVAAVTPDMRRALAASLKPVRARSRVEVELRGREIRVSDDGPGVPPEQREKIFEKFARLGDGPKPPGAGLGLSIARKLAVLHGGTLVCEGNTFILRLP